jgi:hypothetical protein
VLSVYCLSALPLPAYVCVRAFPLKLSIGRLPSAFSPGGYNTQDNLIIYPGRFDYVVHPSRVFPLKIASAGGTRYLDAERRFAWQHLSFCCLMLQPVIDSRVFRLLLGTGDPAPI